MKYLNKYNKSIEIPDEILSDVKETFYNLSDEFDVSVTKFVSTILVNIDCQSKQPKFDTIKDDIEFAIDYLNKEIKLRLTHIHIRRNILNRSLETDYKNYSSLVSDNTIYGFNRPINDFPVIKIILSFKLK